MTQEPFSCCRCGTCCLSAHFGEVHEEDVRLWEKLGRADILQWVRATPLGQGDYAYEVWVDPATGQRVDECPWITEGADRGQHSCQIYEVRPTICKYFPASRKHAEEVGCRGFEGSSP